MELAELVKQPLTFRKKMMKLVGKEVSVFDPQGNLALFVKQKGWKLKEDIRVYADKEMQKDMIYIQARSILDFSAAYDVTDTTQNVKVGVLRRKGMMSVLRDEWELLDANDQPIGKIQEDSMLMALLRRFLSQLIPQSYDFTIGETKVAELKQHFNPFVFKSEFKVLADSGSFDPRLGVAGAVLLMCIEGRQA